MEITKNSQKRPAKLHLGRKITIALITVFMAVNALIFIMPTVLTLANSFMSTSEIAANYGVIFSSAVGTVGKTFVADTVNLKFIPDAVSFSQYITVLLKSPAYLFKFWNSVILVVPIVLFQVIIALLASYGFSRHRGKLREAVFFTYIVLMLMPYQVTLVPNYLVSEWLHILDTRWSIILPGIFSPFAIFILTKYMRRIPVSLIEASKIDGASEWIIFSKVCAPMSKGTIFSVIILVFIDYWNMVEQPIVLLAGNEDIQPLSVFLSQINTSDAGVAFAIASIYMVIPLLIFLYSEDYLIEGVSYYSGGIKG